MPARPPLETQPTLTITSPFETDGNAHVDQDGRHGRSFEKVTHSRNVSIAPSERFRRESTDRVEHYFVGPRDLDRHSKLPIFMRLHGSVMPKMIVPLLFVAIWSTAITCISRWVYRLGISSLLLTVLGFVVGLSLSFRNTTAYERYADGRKYWATLNLTSRNLARLIWVHIPERRGEDAKEDILAKLSAINLILAFAVALKHKLRFEPYTQYEDLSGLVDHLDTFAKAANEPDATAQPHKTPWKRVGEYLGVPMAESNPRKLFKRAKKPLGNMPLEITTYLSAYIESKIADGGIKLPLASQFLAAVASMSEVQVGTERVVNTPLPVAYSIVISQITWIYVLILPFQLYTSLEWITIPASIISAYIILGLAAIGHEIENPFGHDVNDLPLDAYCREISSELDILTSIPPPKPEDFIGHHENLVLFPLSTDSHEHWKRRSVKDIRRSLKAKVIAARRQPMDTIPSEST